MIAQKKRTLLVRLSSAIRLQDKLREILLNQPLNVKKL